MLDLGYGWPPRRILLKQLVKNLRTGLAHILHEWIASEVEWLMTNAPFALLSL